MITEVDANEANWWRPKNEFLVTSYVALPDCGAQM